MYNYTIRLNRIILILFLWLINIECEAQSMVFHIDNNQTILFGDSLTDSGSKLIWHPLQSAFRAGRLNGVHAPNWNLDSIGISSAAFGQNTKASGNVSIAWGEKNSSSGIASTSFGLENKSSSIAATTWGQNNHASAESATVWGESNQANQPISTAWGFQTVANGRHATVWGRKNSALADEATIWGVQNLATGVKATSWGESNQAIGESSSVWGKNNIARSYLETVMGTFADTLSNTNATSWNKSDYILSVGTGSDNSNRHNAMSITKNGKTIFAPNDAQYSLIIDSIRNGSFREPILYPSAANWGYIGSEENYFAKIYSNVFYAGGTNNYLTFSDRRLKTNIQPLSNALSVIKKLRPVSYNRIAMLEKKENPGTTPAEFGLIAQEVEKVLPSMVVTNNSGFKSVGYQAIIPFLIQSLKEQQEIIETYQDQLRIVTERVLALELKSDNKE